MLPERRWSQRVYGERYHERVQLRRLRGTDLADLMALSASAGWNQTAEDWLRMLRLQPDGCTGIEDDGRVVASATVIVYGGRLAWIGMVLTLPEYRGQGLARRLMERSMEIAGSAVVRLDASDMGKPLYERLGFVSECPVERWRREAAPVEEAAAGRDSGYDPLLDCEVFGADRSALLADLARQGVRSVHDAFSFSRAGATAAYFGPCIGTAGEDVEELALSFLADHAGQACAWDLFPTHPAAVIAERLGFQPVRQLTRMVLKPAAVEEPDWRIWAIAGFEYG
jgi:GNAT superfamily N-acetyltransferase